MIYSLSIRFEALELFPYERSEGPTAWRERIGSSGTECHRGLIMTFVHTSIHKGGFEVCITLPTTQLNDV